MTSRKIVMFNAQSKVTSCPETMEFTLPTGIYRESVSLWKGGILHNIVATDKTDKSKKCQRQRDKYGKLHCKEDSILLPVVCSVRVKGEVGRDVELVDMLYRAVKKESKRKRRHRMVKEGGGTKILFLAVQRELTRTNNHSALVSDDKKKIIYGLGHVQWRKQGQRTRKKEREGLRRSFWQLQNDLFLKKQKYTQLTVFVYEQ